MRKGELPLQQVVRRMTENKIASKKSKFSCKGNDFHLKMKHFDGPLPIVCNNNRQFLQIKINGWILSAKDSDSSIITRAMVRARVRNIVMDRNTEIISFVCDQYDTVCDLWTNPLPSSSIGIYKVSNVCQEHVAILSSDLFAKCACFPINDNEGSIEIVSLLHNNI